MHSPKNTKYKPSVFFFNSTTSNMSRYSGELRGFKLKSKDQNKLFTLKTRYVQRVNINKIRSSINQQETENEIMSYRQQRPRFSLQNFKNRSLSKRLSSSNKNLIQQSDMIITSQSNSLPKDKKMPKQLPRFQSSNLQGKMNQYLNLIIRKSHQSHQDKMKKMMQPQTKQQKVQKVSNMYFRRMKLSQNKKKQEKAKDGSLLNLYSNTVNTTEMLQNLRKISKKSQLDPEKQKQYL